MNFKEILNLPRRRPGARLEVYRLGELVELIDVDEEKGTADIRFLDQTGGVVTVDVAELSIRGDAEVAGLQDSREQVKAAILSAMLFLSAQLLLYARYFETRPKIRTTLGLIQSLIVKARRLIQQT
jgi:hypothetical protein